MKNILMYSVLAIFFVFTFSGSAQAYIDPGTGSLLLQGLAAGLVSLLVFWRGLRFKIKNMLNFSKKDKNSEQSND